MPISDSGRPRTGGIVEALRGRRVFLTGATGFLGIALLERLLSDFPETRIVLLVRGRAGSPAEARVRETLGGNAFAPLRERMGLDAFRDLVEERVDVVEGDILDEISGLPGDLDVAVHCAATVSFDSPIDHAFRTNVPGAARIYEQVVAAGNLPHVVHVSLMHTSTVHLTENATLNSLII